MKTKRPFLLYLLVFIFLIGTMVSIIGMIGTLRTWNWLLTFSPAATSVYAVFKGVFLGLACFMAALALWLRYPWSVYFCSTVTILTATWFWVDRIALTRNPLPFNRHIIPVIVTFVILVFMQISLMALNPSMHPHPQNKEMNHPPNLPTGGKNDQTTS